ncbi:MAG: tautomerase family protein [Caldilineaceae bacterium]|nr:tautomerase family protein [Caldilineaceae bacterium]
MAQVKIYGVREKLAPMRQQLSDVIHGCVVEALHFPVNKRAHRFIGLAHEDFFMPEGRTDAYIILEIMMITGRTVETKKKLIRLLFDRIQDEVGIAHQDIEICILESPAANWGFRGMHGDEVKLDYKIAV